MKNKFFLIALCIISISSKSTNAQWVQVVSLTNRSISSIVVSGTYIYAGVSSSIVDGGVYYSTNSGFSWYPVNSGLTNKDVHTLAVGGNTIYAGTSGGIFKLAVGGSSWSNVSSTLNGTTFYSIAISGSNIYAGAGFEGVYYSNNSGVSWVNLTPGTTRTVVSLVISGSNIFAANDVGIYLSSNNGTSWSAITNGLGNFDKAYAHLAQNGSTLYTGTAGGVYKSNDNGSNWIKISSPTMTAIDAFVFSSNNIIAASNGGGIFLSKNGTDWTYITSGVPTSNFLSLCISGSYLITGSFYGDIFIRPLSEVLTAVEGNEELLPNKYELFQNYPNPFNPTTKIKYELPQNSFVNIKIYNGLGKEVRTLLNKEVVAGSHEIEFNDKNLPSGIYFYRIQAGDFNQTRKMILIK